MTAMLERVLARFQETATFKKAVEDEEAGEANRLAWLRELVTLNGQEAKALPALVAARDAAQNQVAAVVEKLTVASAAKERADAECHSVSAGFQSKRAQIESSLRESADPSIALLQDHILECHDGLRMRRLYLAEGMPAREGMARVLTLFRRVRDELPLLPTVEALAEAAKVRGELVALVPEHS